jgi:hypothetical protein
MLQSLLNPDQAMEITNVHVYGERTIKWPENIDPEKMTAVVVGMKKTPAMHAEVFFRIPVQVDHIAGSKTGGRLTVEANMTNLQAKK